MMIKDVVAVALGWLFITLLILLGYGVLISTTYKYSSAFGHEHGGVNYSNWRNHAVPIKQGCCDNQDCRPLEDNEERSSSSGLEVLVSGVGVAKGQLAWCPVLRHHYLSSGNAADSTRSHACVSDYYGGKTPCEQFICYQPKPGV